jgi:hypothetical protein
MADFGRDVGIEFSETASGKASPGISDPAVAAKAGGGAFLVTLNISIPRLQDFLNSATHTAEIRSGTVSWKPDLKAAAVAGGSVTYFRDANPSGSRKFIDYTFSFPGPHKQTIACTGVKDLQPDNGVDAATDLTTLNLNLQANGQIAGAGVLQTHILDFVHQIQSCKVTGAQSGEETGAARWAFLSFVNRQLRDVYPSLPLIFKNTTELTPEQRKTLAVCARLLLPPNLPPDGPQFDDIVSELDRFLANASSTVLTTVSDWLQAIGTFLPAQPADLTLLRMLVTAQLNSTDRSPIRDVLDLLHSLVVFPYYAHPKCDALLHYSRPVHQPRNTPDLPVLAEPPQRVFDFVIAGAGPAGTLLAQRLTAKGKSVLLLEAGPYVPERTIDSDEILWTARLYKSSGLQQANTGIRLVGAEGPTFTVLQGSCVGGGGLVNNAVCFRLPAQRLTQWQSLGFPISAADMTAAYTQVAQELGIRPVSEAANPAPRLNPAWKFLTNKLGAPKKPSLADPPEPGLYECLVNIEDCLGTGLCNVGCGSERKRNGVQVYLRQAAAAGCVIVDNAEVRALHPDANASQGERRIDSLEVRLADGRTVAVKAKEFILSCGPIGSTVVLLNSGGLIPYFSANRIPVGNRLSANLGSPIFAFCKGCSESATRATDCALLFRSCR